MSQVSKFAFSLVCSCSDNKNINIEYWAFKKVGTNILKQGSGREELFHQMAVNGGVWYCIDGGFSFYPIMWQALKNGDTIESTIPHSTPLQCIISNENYRFKLRDISRKLPPGLSLYDLYDYYGIQDLPFSCSCSTLKASQCMGIINNVECMAALLFEMSKLHLSKLTLGADSYTAWKNTYTDRAFRAFFPELEKDCRKWLRNAYWGGKCFINPYYQGHDINAKGYYLDRKGLYAWISQNRPLPYGIPYHGQGKAKPNKLYPIYIQHIRCYYVLLDDSVPVMDNEIIHPIHRFIEKGDLYLTQCELKWFLKYYKVFDLEYVDYYAFKAKKDIFDIYYDKIENNVKFPYVYKKGLKNILLSKFAQKSDIINNIPKLSDDDTIVYDKEEVIGNSNYYLPISVFINSYGRCIIYEAIRQCGGIGKKSIFAYTDTDSVHIICDKIPKFFDKKYWDIKGEFDFSYFESPKTYIERGDNKDNIRICGLPIGRTETLKPEDFAECVRPRKVKIKGVGGVYYKEIPVKHSISKNDDLPK